MGEKFVQNICDFANSIKHKKTVRAGVFACSIFLVLILVGLLSPINLKPRNAAASGSNYVSPATIKVSQQKNTAGLELNVTNSEGLFASSSDEMKAKFGITTNNYTGYTLYISGNSEGKLQNTSSDVYLSSIDVPIPAIIFNTSSYNNRWGYQPNKYNSATNTSFLPAPTATPDTLNKTTAMNHTKTTAPSGSTVIDDLTEDEYTIGVGVRADHNIEAGIYESAINLTIIGNPISYAITYADMSGDSSVGGLPLEQSSVVSDDKVILSTDAPTRNNHTFLKWCLGRTENNGTSCSGTTYKPGDVFSLDQTSDNIIALYAVWSPNIAVKLADGISEVSLNSNKCNTTVDPNASSIGCVIRGLEYGEAYNLVATVEEGYSFASWSAGSYGTIGSINNLATTYTVGAAPSTITPSTNSNAYTINLINTNSTTPGSTSASVAYKGWNVSGITKPKREYTVSGFSTSYNDASGATVSSTANLTSTYAFDGWYSAESGGTKVIAGDDNGQLLPSTPYTDAYGRWTTAQGATLYAGWGSGSAVTLPTIVKPGYTCGWTSSTNTTTLQYISNYPSLVPTENMVLYGICTTNTYDVTVEFGTEGVESVVFTANGMSPITISTSGSKAKLLYGIEYTITMNTGEDYKFENWSINDTSYGTLGATNTNPTTFTPTPASGSAVITANAKSTQIIYIQDFTTEACRENASDSDHTLIDIRDGNTYTVRYINGTCWMTENLRFVGQAGDQPGTMTLDGATSDINLRDSPKVISYVSASVGITSESDTRARIYASDDRIKGAWYNYAAASALSINSDNLIYTTQYSICPAGWTLPTKEQQSAVVGYTYISQFKPIDGGYFNNDGSLVFRGYGDWWGSTQSSSNHSARYTLSYNGSMLSSGALSRHSGVYIRCVRREDAQGAVYMQDITAEIANNIPANTKVDLIDKRDGEAYKITKYSDGMLFMSQNLRFVGGPSDQTGTITLNSTTSNVGGTQVMTYTDLRLGDSYDEARIHVSDDPEIGVWYNYAAATAMEITGSTNSAEPQRSVCPANWRLPTENEVSKHKPGMPVKYDIGYWDNKSIKIQISQELRVISSAKWWSSTIDPPSKVVTPWIDQKENTTGSAITDVSGITTSPRTQGIFIRCIFDAN